MINKYYTRLLVAYGISSLGSWLYRLAVPLLIYHITHSALSMSIAYALTFLPYVVVTPFGGVIADRLSRRYLLVVGDFASAILTLLLGVIFMLAETPTLLDLTLIYALVFLVASVTALYHPAFHSFVPDIVAKEDLSKANSLISSSDNLFTFLGPLLGGSIIALLGAHDAIYFNVVTFFISAILIKTIPSLRQPLAHRFTFQSVKQDLKEGFDSVWHNKTIKFGCLIFLFANFGIQIFYANFMYFLVHILQLTPLHIGITIGLAGLGAIGGSLIAPQFIKRFKDGTLILCGVTLAGILTFLLLGVHQFLQAALVWGCISAVNSIVIVTYFTLRQRVVARELLGRTIALTRLISYTAIPLASILGGWIIQKTQYMQPVILISAITLTLAGLLGWLTPLGRTKSVGEINDSDCSTKTV